MDTQHSVLSYCPRSHSRRSVLALLSIVIALGWVGILFSSTLFVYACVTSDMLTKDVLCVLLIGIIGF